jgi:hypothetical protein
MPGDEPSVPTKEDPNAGGSSAVPTPLPVPTVDPAPPPGPVIEATQGGSDGGAQAPPVATGNNNAPPDNAPATGGGPSSLPAWLALFSAIMMVGGWSLRRYSSAALPAHAESNAAKEE